MSSQSSPASVPALVERLEILRQRLERNLEASPPEADPAEAGEVDRFRITDTNPPEARISFLGEDRARFEVSIPLVTDYNYELSVSCDTCRQPCVHELRALDTLTEALSDQQHPRHEEIVHQLSDSPWTRWLDDLQAAVRTLEQETDNRAHTRLWWSIKLENRSIELYADTPHSKAKKRKYQKLQLEDAGRVSVLSHQNRAAVDAVRWYRSRKRAAARDGTVEGLFYETLEVFIDHPRVCLGPPGGPPWAIKHLPVRCHLTSRDKFMALEIWAGTHRLEASDLRGHSHRSLYKEPEQRILHLLSIPPPVAKLLRVWAERSVPIPEEAQPILMRELSRIAPHIHVEAEDVIRDTKVEPQLDIIALLTPLPQNGLHIEFKVRPIRDGPLFTPGAGLDEVVASGPERQIYRAVRDRLAERRAVGALMEALKLEEDPDRPWTVAIEDLPRALKLVEQLKNDPLVECQWPKQKWSKPTFVRAERLQFSVRKKNDWLEVHGGLSIDNERLELSVLLEAARRDRGYIALDDGRFLELEASLRNRLSLLASHTERHRKSLRVNLSGYEILKDFVQHTEGTQETQDWKNFRAQVESARRLTPIPPEHLKNVLRPYQKDGFKWMCRLAEWGAGAILADDMGLGKTLQAIAVMCLRASLGPQLVVAPTSVVFNWARELKRFAPHLKTLNLTGPHRRKQRPNEAQAGTVILMSYGTLLRDVDNSLRRARFGEDSDESDSQPSTDIRSMTFATLILDEAQAIKNPKTQRARAIKTLSSAWSLALTGTPVENHPAELWALFHAIFPSLLGSFDHFRTRYLPEEDANITITGTSDPRSPDETGAKTDEPRIATGALRRTIHPYILRRTKAQVAQELPPRTEMVVNIQLSHRERSLYDDMRLAAIAELRKEDITQDTHLHIRVLAALTRLRQLACHPQLVDETSVVPSSKLERLLQIVHELIAEGRRALIFSQFTKHLSLVREALETRDWTYAYLDGRTPPKDREKAVDGFQAGTYPLFLLSLKAGGTGLNLTAADTVIHLDPWWNPAVEDQATDRAHRIGQTHPVTVLRLVTMDTIEEKMLEMNRDKRQLVAELLQGSDAPGRLSSEALMALIEKGI